MGSLLDWLQPDKEKQPALSQSLISSGLAMLAGGKQDFGTSLAQGVGAGVKTYAEKFDEARKKALAMAPYKAAMTPAKPAVPAVYKAGGASLPQLGQAQDVAQNMYNLPQGANPYKPPEQDMTGEALGMPASLMPQGMGMEDFSGGQPGQIEEVAAQPAQAASFDPAIFRDTVLQDPTNPAYQKVVESLIPSRKNDEKTAEQKNFEYMQTLPEDQRQMFNKTKQASAPATVQEYEFYNSLSPQDQARFIEMKRAAQIMNLGGTQAVRATGGGIKESYAVTPKPDEMPSFKAEQAAAVESAKAGVERMSDAGKKNRNADNLLANITAAETILKKGNAPGSLVGTGVTAAKRAVGYSDEATKDDKQLKLISGWMVSNVPRMEGPQSNYDVENYRQMAAAVGDSNAPRADRIAALQQLKALQTKYREINQGASVKDLPKKPVTHPKYPGFSIVK